MQEYKCEPEETDVKCFLCGQPQAIEETTEFADELTYTTQQVAYDAAEGKYICQRCAYGIRMVEAMTANGPARLWL